jgi:hypothetical protein
MKAILRLVLAFTLLCSLTACWGDDDATSDNSTNKNTSIDIGRPATFTGKYDIEVYRVIYDNGSSIDTADLRNYTGEMTIRSGNIPTELQHSFSYTIDGNTFNAPTQDFRLIVGSNNKLMIDPNNIKPSAEKVYEFKRTDSHYLILQVDGLTQPKTDVKYDLYIGAEKISNDPDYKRK